MLAVAVMAGCVPKAAAPPPPIAPAPPPPIQEEEIKAAEKPNVAIIDLNETASPDRALVQLRGTLVNRGTRATREISVHVEALDKDGAVIVSADSDPSTESIAPGSTATFAVIFENRPGIDHYHVEAISR